MSLRPGIVWFRRDLRIVDHAPLHAALNAHRGNVLPVYIVSSWKRHHRWTGEPRQRFLCGCLTSLANSLAARGGRLIVREGRADRALEELVEESKASAIYFHRDPDPFGREMEKRVEKIARARGVEMRGFWGVSVHPPDEPLTAQGKPYRVFSPFFRAWNKLSLDPILSRPSRIATPKSIASIGLPDLSRWGLRPDAAVEILEAGEQAARRRLKTFLDSVVGRYARERDRPAAAGTSRLSQDMRFGTLSPREVVGEARSRRREFSAGSRASVDKFIGELAWRDFYLQLLWHFPEVLKHEFDPRFRGLPWRSNHKAWQRWTAGETGYPIVDAGMRQLNATGFMHNRVRMVVAMFLTKDLHLDWRDGERHFMQRLVDGEIASNNGGWQWSAGCGADAAPYFRIQNPWLQSRRYDPDGEYIRRWIPELRNVDSPKLHRPPESAARLAKNYPRPIVDHAVERVETLQIFSEHLAKTRGK